MYKGSKVRGCRQAYAGNWYSLNYHWAHNDYNRMYLCGCHRSFRVGNDRIKDAFVKRIVKSRMSRRFLRSFG